MSYINIKLIMYALNMIKAVKQLIKINTNLMRCLKMLCFTKSNIFTLLTSRIQFLLSSV